MKKLLFVLAVALTSFGGSSWAATYNVQNFDQGWYQDNGSHQVDNTNVSLVEQGYYNFAAFDLSGFDGQTITSATITYAANMGNYDAYQFTDPFEVFDLYDFEGDIDNLLSGTGGVAAFNDLADGSLLGSTNIATPLPANGTQSPNPAGAMPEVSVALNSAGVGYLNSVLSSDDNRIVFGGSSQTLASFPNTQYLWGGSGQFGLGVTLIFEASPIPPGCGPSGGVPPKCNPPVSPVPLPASLPLMLAGLAGLGLVARRRKAV